MRDTPLIRTTESLCPECLQTIGASLIEREGAVYLQKRCPEHGEFELLVSRHPGYYRPLNDFYFSLFPNSLPQRDYIVHLTNKCELNCPICLADANSLDVQDLSLEALRVFLRKRRGCKVDLMGAEPTMRSDLPEIIRLVHRSGNIAALHTNGIRVAEYSYLESLKKAGVDEVHLQFDGFDDAVYERIRGRPLLWREDEGAEEPRAVGHRN